MNAITRFSGTIILLWGWRAAVCAVLAGAASALSMAPTHFFPILFVTFPVLVWLLDGAMVGGKSGLWGRIWPFFRLGWLFGFGYFLASMWWIGQAFLVEADEFLWLLPFAVLLLPSGLAVFWGLGAVVARVFWHGDWQRIVALALGLSLAEWLRGTVLTGFPWNAPGYAAMPVPFLMQSVSLIGLHAMTALTILVAAVPGLLVPNDETGGQARSAPRRLLVALCLLLVAGHAAFGVWRLSTGPTEFVPDVSLRLVQPNIPQDEKWLSEKESQIFGSLVSLSNAATSPEKSSLQGTTLLIWPESVFPFILTQRKDAIAAIAALLPEGTALVAGALRVEQPITGKTDGFTFNSMLLIDDGGEILQARDKVHLVPFGEYLPFEDLANEYLGLQPLTLLQGGFAAGNRRTTVEHAGVPPFLPLICYEIIFPHQLDAAGAAAQWIINLTNDAWYGTTPGPYQHFHQAQVRAAESGLPVVRAANSGISAIIDGHGRIVVRLGLGMSGTLDGGLPVSQGPTWATRLGRAPFWAIWMAMALISMVFRQKNTI